MRTRFVGGRFTFIFAVAGLFVCGPESAQAHPHLIGRWSAAVPPGGLMVYDFGPGEYMGNWTWRGCFTLTVSGHATGSGTYELRMFSGTEGTLGLTDNPGGYNYVGMVDFAARVGESGLPTRIVLIKSVLFHP